MGNLVGQLPALLGVLVGAVGTILATSLTDRSRWRRSQTVRWDERRLDAYAEFARALKEVQTIASRLIGGHLDRDEELTALAEADFRHTLAWESVLLLGDGPTVTAARAWRDAVWEIERLARAGSTGDGLPGLLHRANEARDAFYGAARGGLGVGGGSVAQAALLVSRLNAGRGSHGKRGA
ncbi:hypothetical protein SAMN05443287_102533 [Micromonospora phaseoli]|uniref:Secreted protein n=1 Tax=Micromonospora phaseoli TaxID=1144548 RepID=A0A1H6V4Q4_9ACTN|nr:hypothetical protein [Micromonospora phaseoli]PZV93714.1 hypothetical protein CLV64_109173 [Micromonospora phaseoli]GIJ79195.1 hypothetical protein Xph01_36270 [Micromonospora phaseoli]SEI99511.1 hypothetical protein SAMN05443287_102533 [Micromonospora phaseoli]